MGCAPGIRGSSASTARYAAPILFSALFITSDDPALPDRVAWGFTRVSEAPELEYDYAYFFDVGIGAFRLTYAGPTGS